MTESTQRPVMEEETSSIEVKEGDRVLYIDPAAERSW